jgi:uncharacterized protein
METMIQIDLGQVAREVALPLDKVQVTVELLDDGNTVPFVTRFRKDQTGGLDEEQIRRIQQAVNRLRALTDRKQRILKSLETQGRLTSELAAHVQAADSLRRLEDLYLPFKPKKQTLAGLARSRGLDSLAQEIVAAQSAAANLEARAAEFVNAERGLPTVADVLQGAGHLVAELFGENYPLRDELREFIKKSGKLISTRIEESEQDETQTDDEDESPPHAEGEFDEDAEGEEPAEDEAANEDEPDHEADASELSSIAPTGEAPTPEPGPIPFAVTTSSTDSEQVSPAFTGESYLAADALPSPAVTENPVGEPQSVETTPAVDPSADEPPSAETSVAAPALDPASEAGEAPVVETSTPPEAAAPATEAVPAVAKRAPSPAPLAARVEAKLTIKQLAAKSRKEAKQRKREKKIESFKDYFRHQEPLAKIPPHRALAINRGERSKILRVKIEADMAALYQRAEHRLIRADHPHAEFLRDCLRDALSRLLVPSLEREVRRELTEWAELHAVQVFARNLRQLLLQPPVRDRRVLAIDPGFRSGCKLAAMDEFGSVLGHTVIHVIGKDDIVRRGRQQVVEMVLMYHIPVIAIGNGTACRETERLIADIIAHELKDYDIQYAIVNEAGASVYSTSSVGREELPRFDPVLRSAVSIGRRLQDPLSELVKINPANIGVGLYQHDVKSKHLEESLDAVVESCVNFVGVDANTASPALLRYVSGLNQLTARRMYEYRQKHGPFRSRDQFRNVPGFGDAAFVQAAGFLKIIGGDNPLDATWIHPESYEIAQRVIECLGGSEAELASQLSSRGKIAEVTRPEFGAGVAHVQPAEVAEITTNLSAQPAEDAALQAASREAAAEPMAEASLAEADGAPAIVEPAAESSAESETPAEPVAAAEPAAASTEPAVPDVASLPAPVEEAAVAEPVEADLGDEASAAEPNAQPSLAQRAAQADAAQLARDLGVGELLLRDILNSLKRPGRDPREDLPQPAFRREIMKLEHLQPGMELTGTVLNVVDFGAFVDIGLPDSGLIHISRLADRFVKDPHEIVSVGDILNVWVVDVDRQRRRVSLTAIKPGTERPPQERKEREPPAGRPEGRREGRAEGRGEGRSGRPPQGRRPEGRQPYGQRGGGGGGGGGRPRVTEVRPSKPKPITPITEAMAEGKEPMRSFSDLLQFYGRKPDDEDEKKKKK